MYLDTWIHFKYCIKSTLGFTNGTKDTPDGR